MATVDTYIPLNMLTGFDFSNLLYADSYEGDSGWFTADHSDGTNDTLWGYGFTYDIYGAPWGTGTVTGYNLYGNWSSEVLVDVSGISVPTSLILNAALTPSTADDVTIVRMALAGADTVYGSGYSDVLDGFNGSDTILGYGGNDRLYGDAGNDVIFGMTGNDRLLGGTGADYLSGDAGKDVLVGGAQADRFDFDFISESMVGSTRDSISDFSHYAHDKIDLSTIDAYTGRSGNGIRLHR